MKAMIQDRFGLADVLEPDDIAMPPAARTRC
jgi:hypothetical protein